MKNLTPEHIETVGKAIETDNLAQEHNTGAIKKAKNKKKNLSMKISTPKSSMSQNSSLNAL
jgi:hypothetical protein